MEARIRLTDIAREAGVCRATVVKVLSGGNNNIRVKPQTAERIKEVARRLNYRPNLNARALTGRGPQLIDSMAPPSGWRQLAAIERTAVFHHYRLMTAMAHDDLDKLHESYQVFQQYNVDGVISLAHEYPGEEEKLRNYFGDVGKMVFIGRPAIPGAVYVMFDYADAMRRVLAEVRRSGYRRPGLLIEVGEYASSRLRRKAFQEFHPEPERIFLMPPIDRADAPLPVVKVNGRFRYRVTLSCKGGRAVRELILTQQLDCLLLNNELWAIRILNLLAARGLRIPDDIGIFCTSGSELGNYTDPALSSIRDVCDEIGSAAANLLLDWLSRGQAPQPQLITTDLLVRASSQRPITST